MDIQLKRGLLEICVLASMLKEDMYGYKLIRTVSQYINISESTLYPILKRLESSNFVVTESVEYNGRLRKYYKITALGKNRIQEFMQDWQTIMGVYQYITQEFEDDKK